MKAKSILTGALASLALMGNPNSTTAKAQETTNHELKETLSFTGEKAEQEEKVVSLQEAREKNQEHQEKGYLVLDEEGVKNYFAQHGTVPYLPNGVEIDGDQLLNPISHDNNLYFYLSNNDTVYLKINDLPVDLEDLEGACTNLGDGRIEITGHCVFDVKGTAGSIVVNNAGNFQDKNEGIEISQNDTLYIKGAGVEDQDITQMFGKTCSDDKELGFPKGCGFIVGYEKKIKESTKYGDYDAWDWLTTDDNPLWSIPGEWKKVKNILGDLGYVTPYKTEKVIKQGNTYILEFYAILPVSGDFFPDDDGAGTAHVSGLFNFNGGVPGKELNLVKVSKIEKAEVPATIEEIYNSEHIEGITYKECGEVIDKKNLKVGKTYEMTVKAKEGYYLEKIEINDKTYTLNNQETSYSVSFVAEEKNTVKIDAISTGIEDITVEKPSITAQEGRISIDTKGNAIKELQIYTSSGQLVYQKSEVQGTEEVALHSGIYITRYSLSNGKTEAVKIIVR